MSDFGVTPTGFELKRLTQLLQELNDEMKSIYGDNLNLSPESPQGQINGIVSESNANLWEIAQAVYDAFNPSASSGVSLSNLVQLNGITRQAANSSRVSVTVSGAAGTLIPSGSIVSTIDTNDKFVTETDVTITLSGTASVFVSAANTGAIQAIAGTLTVINTPLTGWNSVTNPLDAIVGRDEETDPELRARRVRSQGKNSQSVIDGMFAGVSDVDGVTQAVVLENDTNIVDANGLPPHSFEVIAVGGINEDIADVIWIKKPAGILSFGNTTVQILDSQNIPHDISFSRPTLIDIFVQVNLTTTAAYPANGDDLIKQAIVDFANGKLIQGEGFGLGETVVYTRLFTPINTVPGHQIDSLFIDIVFPPTGVVNIPIGVTEISNFLVVNIVVNS